MSHSLRRNPFLMFTISVSLFGLFLVIMLALDSPMTPQDFPWRKPVIGTIFGLICVLGIIVVFFPKQCSGMFHSAKGERDARFGANIVASHGSTPALRGHHPDCENFSAHVIRMNDETLCAACTGLLLGALMALAGDAFYFFGGQHMPQNGFLVVLIGVMGLGLGLFQIVYRGFVRLLSNAVFVLGAFLVLVGIDELGRSVLVDLFLVALIVFWLYTRILLSEWDHGRICYTCKFPCEIRKKQKKANQYRRLSP